MNNMIENVRKNIMGTTSFDAKFPKMRKPQDFIVYPIKGSDSAQTITVQSDTRFGRINMETGEVTMSKPRANSCAAHLLMPGVQNFTLSDIDLQSLKMHIFTTANKNAGKEENGIMSTDNSGAIKIL